MTAKTHTELVMALNAIAQTGYGELRTEGAITVPSTIVINAPDYWRIRWTHVGPPVKFTGLGSWLKCTNLKDSLFDGVQCNGNWEFWATDVFRPNMTTLYGSTNNVELVRCDSGGLRIMAPNGEDACNFHVRDTDFTGGGVVIVGSNNLEHLFENVNSSGAGYGYSLRNGGSGTIFTKCGGSDNTVLFHLNSGYNWPKFNGGRGERNKTTFLLEGGGAGFGLSLEGREDVNTVDWVRGVCTVLLEAKNTRVSGDCKITLDNPFPTKAALDVRSVVFHNNQGQVMKPTVRLTGSWEVLTNTVQ